MEFLRIRYRAIRLCQRIRPFSWQAYKNFRDTRRLAKLCKRQQRNSLDSSVTYLCSYSYAGGIG